MMLLREYTRTLRAFGALLLALWIVSCGSSAPPTEGEPQPPSPAPAPQAAPAEETPQDPNSLPPDQAALDAYGQLKDRVAKARERAIKFGGPTYCADDFNAAEGLYDGAMKGEDLSTLGTLQASQARFEAAAYAFDDVFAKALPLYAQALENDIRKARAEAIDAGIEDLSVERLAEADDQADGALKSYADKDYDGADEAAKKTLNMYLALKVGCDAWNVRSEIEDYGFGNYDTQNYGLADASWAQAVDSYDAGDAAAALEQGQEALLRYNLVLIEGWKTYATERQAQADVERQRALDLKANVAVRDDYNAAAAFFTQAQGAFQAEEYQDAAEGFFKSEYMFASVSAIAAEKRRLAEEAIKTADEKAAHSDEVAQRADEILQGGSK